MFDPDHDWFCMHASLVAEVKGRRAADRTWTGNETMPLGCRSLLAFMSVNVVISETYRL